MTQTCFSKKLPDAIADTRPIKVLEQSLHKGKLAHAILLHGDDMGGLETVGLALAGALLENSKIPSKHPDLFTLRPANKMRQINIAETRELIRKIQLSSHQGGRKVAIIYEIDRMNKSSANAFLKTLEEPPEDTTILLLTTRPYDLLDTIRSRCFNFRLPVELEKATHPEWEKWLSDYTTWLETLSKGAGSAELRAKLIIMCYALIDGFQKVLAKMSDEGWKSFKESLPENLTDDEISALEVGQSKGLRQKLFTDIEKTTRIFSLNQMKSKPVKPGIKLVQAVENLEREVGLLEVNLSHGAVIESFLLASLHIWVGH